MAREGRGVRTGGDDQFAPAQVRPEEVRAAAQTAQHVMDEVEKEIAWKN